MLIAYFRPYLISAIPFFQVFRGGGIILHYRGQMSHDIGKYEDSDNSAKGSTQSAILSSRQWDLKFLSWSKTWEIAINRADSFDDISGSFTAPRNEEKGHTHNMLIRRDKQYFKRMLWERFINVRHWTDILDTRHWHARIFQLSTLKL